MLLLQCSAPCITSQWHILLLLNKWPCGRGQKYLLQRRIKKKKNKTNLSFAKLSHSQLSWLEKWALTAFCDRVCGSVSTATGRWTFQWCSGWDRGWGGVPPRSPGRTAARRGRPAPLSETSCRWWQPPSGSASPPQRWCGRAGGCGLRDKVAALETCNNLQQRRCTTTRCRIHLISSHLCS